jgi:PAS domain S-box-containing protein
MIVELLYVVGLSFACFLTLWIAYRAWLNRETTGATALGVTASLAAVWAGGQVGVSLATGDTATLRWHQFSYLGIVWTPAAFAVLALSYTGYNRYLTRRVVASLVAAGGVFLALIWTNPAHHLYWTDTTAKPTVLHGISISPGPAFWLFVLFSYALLLVGSALLVRYALTAPDLYRVQTNALLLAVAAPWAANIPSSLQLVSIDLTPISLSVTAVAVWVAMFRYQLTSVTPVALRTVFESISMGVYVLDRQGRVVDVNRAGRDLLGLDEGVVGEPFADAVPGSVADGFRALDDGQQAVLEIEGSPTGTESRYYSVQVTPVETGRGRQKGRLYAVADVTDRHRQRQQLETQNERLQEFTSVVSHDLRNPLNIAVGHLGLAQEDCESDHLDTVEQGLMRMETLIDDLLALARQGLDIDDPEEVDLAAVVTAAWGTVETRTATLDNKTTAQVLADRSRLHQLFENLVRNAIEHGGESVTVTVGDRTDGFYVADDGPGIPPEERETVFDTGYSTAADGTGFGLPIVQRIVEAHGWEIEVTESAGGGARFDITGVPLAE